MPKISNEPDLLADATFKIQNLDEAKNLAELLAEECPNPILAALGINEILINAIEHGNLGITYNEKTQLDISQWLAEINRRLAMPENKNKFVTVKVHRSPSQINIRITDEGDGFDWLQYQTADKKEVLHNHGNGIIMAHNLSFQSMIYHGKGNDVECIILLTNP